MSKFSLFVFVYSGVMLVLFFTFCFLMTTINPPPTKKDPESAKRFGSDDFIFSNELLANDKVAYGLEKVYDDYDSVDVITKNVIENRKNIPTIYVDKNFKTKKKILTMTTRSMKLIKGLRRSVNNETKQDAIPQSVHLKIKDQNGQPRVEIKVIPEKSKSTELRKYTSSTNNINNTLKLNIDNDKTKYVYDEISKEVVLVMGNNEKIVIDVAKDSINLYYDTLDSVNDINNTNKDDKKLSNNNNFTETNDNKKHSLNTSSVETNTSQMVVMNRTESNNTDIEKTTQAMSKERTNESNSIATSFNSVTFVETKTEMEFIQNSTKDFNATTEAYSDDRQSAETTPGDSVPVNTLVGLLIPEATATLPLTTISLINY